MGNAGTEPLTASAAMQANLVHNRYACSRVSPSCPVPCPSFPTDQPMDNTPLFPMAQVSVCPRTAAARERRTSSCPRSCWPPSRRTPATTRASSPRWRTPTAWTGSEHRRLPLVLVAAVRRWRNTDDHTPRLAEVAGRPCCGQAASSSARLPNSAPLRHPALVTWQGARPSPAAPGLQSAQSCRTSASSGSARCDPSIGPPPSRCLQLPPGQQGDPQQGAGRHGAGAGRAVSVEDRLSAAAGRARPGSSDGSGGSGRACPRALKRAGPCCCPLFTPLKL